MTGHEVGNCPGLKNDEREIVWGGKIMGGKLSGYAIITGWELSGRGIIHDSILPLKKLGK